MAYFIPGSMNWSRVIFVLAIIYFGLIKDSIKAQTLENSNYRKNEVSIELLGSGVQYSINYERSVYNKSRFDFKVKTGLTFSPIRIRGFYDYRAIGFNIESKILYGINQNKIELGFGYTYIYLYDLIVYADILGCCSDLKILVPRIGYRRYNKKMNKYVNISFTPLLTLDLNEEGDEYDNNSFIPFGGIGYGWKF